MIASVLPKILKVGSAIKGAYEWFSFAEEAVSRLGLIKRAAAGAAAAAVIVAPAVVTLNQAPSVTNATAQVVSDKVITAGFLSKPENEELFKKLSQECQNAQHANVEQCNQVSAAAGMIWKRDFFQGAKGKW